MPGMGMTVGLIKALGGADPAVIEQSVSDWLDDHPEATTTVQDGSITKAKLDENLQGTVDDVSALKNDFNDITDSIRTNQLLNKDDPNIVNGIVNAQNTIVSSSNSIVWIPVSQSKNYVISKTESIGRFVVYLFTNEPDVGAVASTNIAVADGTWKNGSYIKVSSSLLTLKNANYIAVYFRHATVDASYTEYDILSVMKIEEGTTPTEGLDYYVKKVKNSALDLDSELSTSSDKPVQNKAVAEEFERLDGIVAGVESDFYVNSLWEKADFEDGTMSTTTGENVSSDYRIRMKERYIVPFNMKVKNSTGYTLNIFTYTAGNVTNTGYPEDDTITEYQLTAGDQVRIVISRYPLSTDTNVDDYIALQCVDVTQFENINSEIEGLKESAGTKAQENETFSNAEFFRTEDITYLGTKYFVGKNGDYQTINAALTAWANDNYPPAVVFIENGEYNETVFVENKTIAFIGESKDGTIIRTKTGDYSHPPFKIHHGNVLVANLTAIADHTATPDFAYVSGSTMAYAFHIDGGSVGGEVVIRNCRAVSYQSPAFGMGLIPDSTIRLEDVESYTYTDDTTNSGISLNNGSILCHLADNTLYPTPGVQTIQLVNVRAYSKNTTRVVVLPQGDSPTTLQLTAINLITSDGKNGDGNSNIILPIKYALDDLCYGNSASKLNK